MRWVQDTVLWLRVHPISGPAVAGALASWPSSAACSLRASLQGTMLVALLQPSPETFELFDEVMLLASGMVRRLAALSSLAN